MRAQRARSHKLVFLRLKGIMSSLQSCLPEGGTSGLLLRDPQMDLPLKGEGEGERRSRQAEAAGQTGTAGGGHQATVGRQPHRGPTRPGSGKSRWVN